MGDDLFGYVTARLDPEDLRQGLAGCVKTLKQNKALESCKINGLPWVSLDANERFASRSRCCDGCCRRQVEETGPDGLKRLCPTGTASSSFWKRSRPRRWPSCSI